MGFRAQARELRFEIYDTERTISRVTVPGESRDITALLAAWRAGSEKARDEVVLIVYQELKSLAHHYLSQERPDHTLQTTALVHELYLKLCSSGPVDWQDRPHFLAVAARQLRHILIDYARTAARQKRGGGRVRVTLADLPDPATPREEEVISLDDALTRLEGLAARSAQVVEMRFFAGMTEKEIAEVTGTSVATVKRDWDFARSWLITQLAT
jgi:RNA polymerase sigma factor (TIGR02999 family)